jgi:hypothetical protein
MLHVHVHAACIRYSAEVSGKAYDAAGSQVNNFAEIFPLPYAAEESNLPVASCSREPNFPATFYSREM